jgi:tRNA U34 5-methylaminomethyl-2-thiouridine-forming methyltransferase MnmC
MVDLLGPSGFGFILEFFVLLLFLKKKKQKKTPTLMNKLEIVSVHELKDLATW